MTTIDTGTTLAALIDINPALSRKLEQLGLDYCCHGQRSLGDACASAGLDTDDVVSQLQDVDSAASSGPGEWTQLSLGDLVDHVESLHHTYLHEELPRLMALAEKVRMVHGDRHPELVDVLATFTELRDELDPHLHKEEAVLFPAIRRLAGSPEAPQPEGASLSSPISVMLAEHDHAGDLLARLRELTSGYQTPADGCASYQALYMGLAEMENDTHLHIHKENNRMFPMALELEGATARSA